MTPSRLKVPAPKRLIYRCLECGKNPEEQPGEHLGRHRDLLPAQPRYLFVSIPDLRKAS